MKCNANESCGVGEAKFAVIKTCELYKPSKFHAHMRIQFTTNYMPHLLKIREK